MRSLHRLPVVLLLGLSLSTAAPVLARVHVQQGGTIYYGEAVEGRVADDDGESWVFSGQEGDEVRIEMYSSSMDTYLELLGPNGDLLTTDDDGAGGTDSLIDHYVLPEAGRYTIVARGYAGEVGPYTLSLERTGSGVEVGGGGGSIGFGETVGGRVSDGYGVRWTFSARAGDVVTIRMESYSMDTYLELLGPDGFPVTEDDDGAGWGSTDSLIENYWLAEGGTYTIVARGYEGDTGSYDLTLERVHRGGGVGADSTLVLGLGLAAALLCLIVVVVGGVAIAVLLNRRQPA